jgi:hypothetical protein
LALAICVIANGAVLSQGAPRNEDGTFRNNYPHATTDFGDFLRWQSERTAISEPDDGWRIPVVAIDLAALHAPLANPSVTWIGHATVLVRIAGKNILVDPIFSERASPVPLCRSEALRSRSCRRARSAADRRCAHHAQPLRPPR